VKKLLASALVLAVICAGIAWFAGQARAQYADCYTPTICPSGCAWIVGTCIRVPTSLTPVDPEQPCDPDGFRHSGGGCGACVVEIIPIGACGPPLGDEACI